MHDSYTLLELSAVKEQVAHYAAFSFGKQKVMNLQPIHNILALKKELAKCMENVIKQAKESLVDIDV